MRIRGFSKLVNVLRLYSRWRKGEDYKPQLARLLVTTKCNSRCVMCNVWRLAKEKPEVLDEELSTDEWIGLIRELSEMGTEGVFISGGEPLQREGISDIIRCAKERKMAVEMVTNGTLLKESKAEELVALGLDIIDFSVDGPVSDIHEELRGVKGSWEGTVRGIKLISQAKKKLGAEKPSINVSYTLSRTNYELIDQIVDLKSELGYSILHFNPIVGKTPEVEKFFLRDEDIGALESQLDSLVAKYRSADMPISALSRIHALCREREGSREGNYAEILNKKVLCFRPFKEPTIDPFGNVYPCSFSCPFQNLSEDLDYGYWGTDDFCMGNIRSDGFRKIWTGEKYRQLRSKFKEFAPFSMCAWCQCRSANDALLTGLFKDRSLLFKIVYSKIRQRFKKSRGFEWEFLYD